MAVWRNQAFSQQWGADCSDTGSEDFGPPQGLKTIYSGISIAFSTKVTQLMQPTRWKPVSTRAVVLIPFIVATLALAAIIEMLAQKSMREGGLCLTPEADATSPGVISSRYGPTAIAVIYSLTWTWIDLDIRRIQPWLELSRADGGTAESTLLLDYPFEFLAFVPIKAWKKKHWLVFLAGTIMMLIFWAVTPLQSAIFGAQAVSVTKQLVTSDTAKLGTLEEQLNALDSSILNIAYGITWLKQPYPAFTTPAKALIPFQPLKPEAAVLPDETWTTSAVALSTDIHCWPAIVNKTELTDTFDFDNGQGCKATFEPSTHGRLGNETGIIHTVLYIGYHENAMLDWYLQNPNCGANASHQFLAIWMAQDTKDMTALFCESVYSKQEIMVTVSAGHSSPDEMSMAPLGDPKPLGEDEFNSTAFEYLVGTGVPPKLVRRDYPKDRNLEQFPTLSEFNLAFPITNMVGFAIGGMNYSIMDLKDAAALQNIFSSAHKKLFSAAIPSLLMPAELSDSARTSTIRYTLYGVVVSRPLALAVEILLFLIALLVAGILYVNHRTKSLLNRDPGCIASTLEVLGESDALLRDFATSDRYDDVALQKSVQGRRCPGLSEEAGRDTWWAAQTNRQLHNPTVARELCPNDICNLG
ncbi:Protein AIG2 [Coniochaeta hoffmannii]|uniref:Protein AIG2 n=1 Tax=Coniochaeta hoffmannii TaxID=91930 RepID=A0AA38W1E0_9PEZI|nr:Protein AIG2 [Coniochaeta hoffmannii]